MATNDLTQFSKRPNGLLASLPREELARLQQDFEAVELPLKHVLHEANQPIEHAFFLHRGVVSLVRTTEDGAMVEVGTVGNEGMVGLPLALGGSEMVSQALMQIPGDGVRIARDAFARALSQSPTLHQRLMRYTLALLAQISLSVACNRAHSVEQRCARWLLMTHDRIGESTFPLTQEFLAQMLGVRRPTVSLAAGMLQKADLITYARGKITILSRAGLEQMSCECYRTMVDEYKKAFR